MKQVKAFLHLVRWPNLLYIAFTQVLFVYCILHPIFQSVNRMPVLQILPFLLVCLSSICIAAAGYIINDYFDVNIDEVNKPKSVVIDKIISRRKAVIWHFTLSATGIGIGIYLDAQTPISFLGFANFVCVVLLFIYSISLKRKLLIGNVLISLLTAWVIVVLPFCESVHFFHPDNIMRQVRLRVSRYTFLYAGFAFVISLIREVVKDMEDVEGDAKDGCKTLPIVWGMNAAKIFVLVWLFVLIALVLLLQVYVMQLHWWFSILYALLAILLPLLYVFKHLVQAQTSKDYHHVSSVIKWVMFTGIVSMVFVKIYL